MSKLKIWLLVIGYWLLRPSLAMAVSPTVAIQDLPNYVTTDNFKLSCSALGGSEAQFAYKKEGGVYQNFGGVIDLTTSQCQVQVGSSIVSDQTKYYFKVTLDGSVSDETSTIYDVAGPSPVTGYKKDDAGNNNITIHWKNPSSEDFSKVIIYRGETVDFSADSNHEIATVAGSPDSEMTHTVNVPDASKTYYYVIRALDKAGNSSSLVGDGGTSSTSTVVTQNQPQTATNGKVTSLPKEGQILGEETDVTEEQTSVQNEGEKTVFDKISSRIPYNKSLYIGGGLLILAVVLYLRFKKYKHSLPLRGKK